VGVGRAKRRMNSVKHDIDFEHDITIGKTENLQTLSDKIRAASLVICAGLVRAMVFAVDLNDDPCRVTKEVDHVRTNGDLTAKMRSLERHSLSEVPPQP